MTIGRTRRGGRAGQQTGPVKGRRHDGRKACQGAGSGREEGPGKGQSGRQGLAKGRPGAARQAGPSEERRHMVVADAVPMGGGGGS
jgi:hypothetical protein